MKAEESYNPLFQALLDVQNTLAETLRSLDEYIRRAQLECVENAFQQQKDAVADCLDGIDQQLIKLGVYLEEYQRLFASLNDLNGRIPRLGGTPLSMPEALAGDSLETILARRIAYLKSQGKM